MVPTAGEDLGVGAGRRWARGIRVVKSVQVRTWGGGDFIPKSSIILRLPLVKAIGLKNGVPKKDAKPAAGGRGCGEQEVTAPRSASPVRPLVHAGSPAGTWGPHANQPGSPAAFLAAPACLLPRYPLNPPGAGRGAAPARGGVGGGQPRAHGWCGAGR